jgi:hypothetical protein
MEQHVKILAVLNIIYGGLLVIAAVFVFLVMGGIAGFITASDTTGEAVAAAPIVGMVGVGIAIFFLVLSAPSIIAGLGLLKFRPWARILTIILSALHLLSIPFGTALGIYGLWVLLHPQTEAMFRGAAYPAYPPPPPARL